MDNCFIYLFFFLNFTTGPNPTQTMDGPTHVHLLRHVGPIDVAASMSWRHIQSMPPCRRQAEI